MSTTSRAYRQFWNIKVFIENATGFLGSLYTYKLDSTIHVMLNAGQYCILGKLHGRKFSKLKNTIVRKQL